MSRKNNVLSSTEQGNVLLTLAKKGHKKPKNWKLVHCDICDDSEDNFNPDRLLRGLAKRHKRDDKLKFAVQVISTPDLISSLDTDIFKIRYRYVIHSKYASEPVLKATSREFCQVLVNKNKLYRKEDITNMSFSGSNPDFNQNYSIFQYRGSYGCRHKWQREVYLLEE